MAQENQIVAVTVKKVRKSGLEVEAISTGEKGFVPRREFDWDQRINKKIPAFQPGQTIEAVPVEEEESGRRYYSVKRTSLVL